MRFKTRLMAFVIFLTIMATPVQATVKIGVVFFYPPYVMSINEGFDIDLIRLLFQRLNQDYELIPMDFNKLFSALNSGQIDLAIGGINISFARKKNYIFSLPYMLSEGQFLVLKGSNILDIMDLKGKQVGVIKGDESGGVFYSFLFSKYNQLFTLEEYNDMEDMITALTNGTIAAAFLHKSTADYWVQNSGNQFKEMGRKIQIGLGIGIMALPVNAPLIQQINQQLQNVENDSSYLKLYSTYFATN